MNGFFEELYRRKVYPVAVAYIIVAGGVIAAFRAWDLPNWALRLVIVVLLLGFPIALLLAWAYDITAQGVQTTPTTAVPRAQRRRNIVILMATGVAISAAAAFFLLPRAVAGKIDKSIAVLPFENLSNEKETAYFADGIQDDVLTNLSKVGDLKVISSTSVMPYRGKNSNAREIGKTLGVGAILEGSVRRIGNRVRVNVQLINAETDEHMWATDYDRDLTDVFAIQTDLAQQIVRELQAKLSPSEKAQIERRPTQNGEAYLAFVQAHDRSHAIESLEKLKQGEQLYQRAIDLDPNFALAMARYSQLESRFMNDIERTPERREKARSLAERAIQLQPDLPEAHLALGFSYYYGDRNCKAALREFEIARLGLPNESEVSLAIGAIQRRQGKWAESTVNLEKAAALDPKNAMTLDQLALNYMALRNFDAAGRTLDRAIAAAPQAFEPVGLKTYLAILSNGDITLAEKQLSSIGAESDLNGMVTWARSWVLMLQRKFPEALAVVQKFPGEIMIVEGAGPIPKPFLEGIIHLLQGNKEKAQPALEHARLISEQLLRDAHEDPRRHAQHGFILAALDRKQEAIAEGKRAVELRPESKDAFDGPKITASLAEIYALTGESDEAFRLIEHLLEVPNGLTVPLLKLDPVWDPLRKDPRFQALIDRYAAKP